MLGSEVWWKREVIYQVLVPSFQDSNGDGWGDLPGVRARLDYIAWLGAGAIWLSPIYSSPFLDLGYDVSDYTSIHPQFGTLDDFDALVADAHRLGLKVILDWVAGHTSSQHPWFIDACRSRTSAHHDWYLWHDAQSDGSPPNNWLSIFGGSAWTWHEGTGQYYYHTFLAEQPELNWRNAEMRGTMHDAMRFWLRRGIDGFRLDAIDLIAKDDQYHDNPPNPNYDPARHGPDEVITSEFSRNRPEVHPLLADIRDIADEYGAILLGEIYLLPEKFSRYYGRERPELHLPLYMLLAWCEWNAESLAAELNAYYAALHPHKWPSVVLSVHDVPRIAARSGVEQTRVAALLLLALPGTPILYYGEELGMCGVPIPAEEARDPQGRRIGRNRDPSRTPMQWGAAPGAGFTTGVPWLPIGDDLSTANVETQRNTDDSLLSLFRKCICLRRQLFTAAPGHLRLWADGDLLLIERQQQQRRYWIALNLSGEPHALSLDDQPWTIVLTTDTLRTVDDISDPLSIPGHAGVILGLEVAITAKAGQSD